MRSFAMPSLITIFRDMPDPRSGNARRHSLLDVSGPRPSRPRAKRHAEDKAARLPGAARSRGDRCGTQRTRPTPARNCLIRSGFRLHRFMAHVDHFDQSGAKETVLLCGWLSRIHIVARNRRVPAGIIRNPALHIQHDRTVPKPNQPVMSCSGRTNERLQQCQTGTLTVTSGSP